MARYHFQLHNNMNISMIAAIGQNNELGKDNKLIWRIPEDLKFFRNVTTGKTIIMGRNTFASLPKMLPNRKHIVFSSKSDFPNEVEVYKSIQEFLQYYKNHEEELFVIGGGQIYDQFLNLSTKLYLTEIDAVCTDADTYFPKFNKEEWSKEVIDQNVYSNIEYRHVLYRRK